MTHVAYPGCYCADCVEGSPHERHNDLRGYIVGNGDRTKWRAWINGMPAWVDNPADATRYGFRSDANAVHAEDEDAWCVVKYEDVATPSARITGDKEWYDRGGFANPALFRKQSRGGAWRYYVALDHHSLNT